MGETVRYLPDKNKIFHAPLIPSHTQNVYIN